MKPSSRITEETLDIFSDKLKETLVFCDNETNFMRGGKMYKIDRAKILGMIKGALIEVIAQGRKEAYEEILREMPKMGTYFTSPYNEGYADCLQSIRSILSAKVEGE